MERERKSHQIIMNPDIHRQAKIEAIIRNMTVGEVIEEKISQDNKPRTLGSKIYAKRALQLPGWEFCTAQL